MVWASDEKRMSTRHNILSFPLPTSYILGRGAMEMKVQGRRKRGWPKRRLWTT